MIELLFWLVILVLSIISTFLVFAYAGGMCTWIAFWLFNLHEVPEAKVLGKRLAQYWNAALLCLLVHYGTITILPYMRVFSDGG